jgi:phosphotransferase system enzyme I (PtsI)
MSTHPSDDEDRDAGRDRAAAEPGDLPVEAAGASGGAAGERVLRGTGVAPGVAIGHACLYAEAPSDAGPKAVDPAATDAEIEVLDQALDRAAQDLERTITLAREKLGEESVAILEAQKMMVRDEELVADVRRRIRDNREGAGRAVRAVLQAYRRRLEESGDEYLRERASDLTDVRDRILRALRRGRFARSIDPETVVVADTLGAADLVRFSQQGALGCATDRGGQTSHVSIIARALGVPAVVGVQEASRVVRPGDTVVVDGLEGRLVVRPTDETLAHYRGLRDRYERLVRTEGEMAALPAETADGETVSLEANVEFDRELDLLKRYGAEGIGLLRTEMLFLMDRRADLSEDRQVAAYRRAAAAARPGPATVRLLDLGGDKMLPLAHREQNPFLGWRGIRVLLDRPEILRPQLRALLRAGADHRVRALAPMVTHLDEVEGLRCAVAEEADRLARAGVRHEPDLPIGIMVETPAVALQAGRFAREADFFSIGTNDLTQYVLAVDRGNDLVGRRYDALHPAVLDLVARTVEAGREAGIPVTLCGELASDPVATPLLLGLGLRSLSASPTYLPAVKRMVRRTPLDAARALAAEARGAPDAAAVRRHAQAWIGDRIDDPPFDAASASGRS